MKYKYPGSIINLIKSQALHWDMISSNPKFIENNRGTPHKCEVDLAVKYTIIHEMYAIICC